MNRLILFLVILTLHSCKGQVEVSLLRAGALSSGNSTPATPSLNFSQSTLTILSGDTLPFTTTNGLGPYTANTFSMGTFDPGTTSYSAPSSSGPFNSSIAVTDQNGLTGNLPVKIIGLNEKFLLDQTLSFGDQNYPTSIAQSANGSLYASSIISDGIGWEGWAIWKSTDNGSSWSVVDKYFMYAAGESHPMQIATKGNDVYVCGYVWGYGGTPSLANAEWLVKKSSDGGASWQITDHWWANLGDNICNSITTSASGDIFTTGFSNNVDSYVRISADNGTSWQQIGYFPGAGRASNIEVSPNGNLWVLIGNNIYTGVYTLGSWNWSGPFSITGTGFGNVAYQKVGGLEIVSNTHAYFTGRISNTWRIFETTDAGVTWSQIHSRSGEGVTIKVLSTGEILSSGNRNVSFSEHYNEIIKSVDGGSTFNLVMQKGAVSLEEEGGFLIELQNGDILSLGKRSLDEQMMVYRSTDKGSTWSQASIITFYDRFYSEISDYAEDSLGNMYTAGWIYNVDPLDPSEPYVIMKSSNNGATWTQSDYIKQSGVDHYSDLVEVNNLDNVFAIDYSYDTGQSTLRMSTNQGTSWSNVDVINGSISEGILEADVAGNIYYLSALVLRRGSPTGTGFTTAFTFPVNGGQTSFRVITLEGLSDGSLLLGAYAFEGATGYNIVYRSTDQGGSWNELYKTSGNSWSTMNFQESSNGDYIALIGDKILKSINNGVAWTEIYDGSLGDPESMILSTDSRVFFNTQTIVYYYSVNTSSWNVFWNIENVLTPVIDSEVKKLFKCRFSSIGVCANVLDYTKNQGSANYLWSAE